MTSLFAGPQPLLRTGRLVLRPLAASDASDVATLAGAWEVADTTANLPHPYPGVESALAWIESTAFGWRSGLGAVFAITAREDGRFLGVVSLGHINIRHLRANLGYWIGVPFWGRGFATEAARRVIRFGFEDLALGRIESSHFIRNPASGRVMEKAGMSLEGVMRHWMIKNGSPEDLVLRAIVRPDWLALAESLR